MTLRTLQVPDPRPGDDWQTVVPGQYIYNVTGITATLATANPPAVVAVDSSGNHNDGFYVGGWNQHQPGLVAGNDAADTVNGLQYIENFLAYDFSVEYTFEGWHTRNVDGPAILAFDPAGSNGQPVCQVQIVGTAGNIFGDPAGAIRVIIDGVAGPCVTPAGRWVDPGPHMLDVACRPDVGEVRIYVDGALTDAIFVGPWVPVQTSAFMTFKGPNVGAVGTVDELAFYPFAMTSGEPTVIYNAAAGGIGPYALEVLANNPLCYYHMDDPRVSHGKQVTLAVTNGVAILEQIPTGFLESAATGSFRYSWQPNLNSSAQTPDQRLTTVAIPPLVLPAGYVLETITPDLGPDDQWTDVVVWWSDDVMSMLGELPPYANTLLLPASWAGFPGGVP